MTPDIAVLWAIVAFGLLVIGVAVFMAKKGFLENETHLDKMNEKGG